MSLTFHVRLYNDMRPKHDGMNGSDYLMRIWEHEEHEFPQHISGVDSKEILKLVHGHESADLKGRKGANVNFTHRDFKSFKV